MTRMIAEREIAADMHPAPLTMDGSALLHQMFRFDWPAWRGLEEAERKEIVAEAQAAFAVMEAGQSHGHPNQSAMFAQLGHKGDLMFVHFRETMEELAKLERDMARLRLSDYLEPMESYVSVVELGLYESSAKVYAQLAAEGVEPHSEIWNQRVAEVLERQSTAMAVRLFPAIPQGKYLCFYPMDRKRGEEVNWYTESMAERQRMMHDHGMIGRRYADVVRQVISGSIGFDDWEWGVDLFSDDATVFKKLIYEMRFDEASALYAEFGPFYIGVRLPAAELGSWLAMEGA
ncbi:MAG: hydrogen peroxide-dependent heme synthase [Acidobacteriaceae bacterium]